LRLGNAACCTAPHGVICHPEPCTMECSIPVTNTDAPQRSR
jgi:hypothetical protein